MNGISASAESAGRAPRAARSLIVAAVWAVALVGVGLGVAALGERNAPAPAPRSVGEQFNAPRLGGRVLTSFGSLSVSSVEDLVGPARAMHLTVPRGMHPIQVNVTVNNLQRRTVGYDKGWFRVVGRSGSYPVAWSTSPRRLAPLSTKGVLLRFAVAPGARLPRLEYLDPSGRAPVRIDLGSARNLQTFNPATHQHGG
jgi:hypothetical protein